MTTRCTRCGTVDGPFTGRRWVFCRRCFGSSHYGDEGIRSTTYDPVLPDPEWRDVEDWKVEE